MAEDATSEEPEHTSLRHDIASKVNMSRHLLRIFVTTERQRHYGHEREHEMVHIKQ